MARRGLATVGLVVLVGCVAADAGGLPDDPPNGDPAESADADAFDPLAIPSGCPADAATGTDIGQIPANFELYDAEGEAHRLWDHCGETIMIFAGARW